EKLRLKAFDPDFAAGDESGREKCARLDAIAHDLVVAGAELCLALNADDFAALALDLGAHGAKRPGQIDDLRLAGAVLKHRLPLRKHGRHHDVFGRTDARELEYHPRALELFGRSDHVAAFQLDLRAQLLKPREMEI